MTPPSWSACDADHHIVFLASAIPNRINLDDQELDEVHLEVWWTYEI